jgi:hypothetical protein
LGEFAVDQLGDRFDREGDLGVGDRLEVLEEAMVFAAGFHWGEVCCLAFMIADRLWGSHGWGDRKSI